MNRWLLYGIALTLAALAVSLFLLVRPDLLPERVPVHWDIHGQPNQFVPRDQVGVYLLLVPGTMAGFLLLWQVLPWLSPVQFGIDRFRRTYDYLMALVLTLLAYLHGVALAASLQVPLDFNKVFLGGIFLFFALIGNVLGKVQRNFYVGIRTPWTLADETVWIRTHRVAAWLFTAGSLACFVALMAGAAVWILFVALMVIALVPVLYSLILYKRLQKQGKIAAAPADVAETVP